MRFWPDEDDNGDTSSTVRARVTPVPTQLVHRRSLLFPVESGGAGGSCLPELSLRAMPELPLPLMAPAELSETLSLLPDLSEMSLGGPRGLVGRPPEANDALSSSNSMGPGNMNEAEETVNKVSVIEPIARTVELKVLYSSTYMIQPLQTESESE